MGRAIKFASPRGVRNSLLSVSIPPFLASGENPGAIVDRLSILWIETNRLRIIGNGPLQLLIANLDYSDYLGRLAIGRIFSGHVAVGDTVAVAKGGSKFDDGEAKRLTDVVFRFMRRLDRPGSSATSYPNYPSYLNSPASPWGGYNNNNNKQQIKNPFLNSNNSYNSTENCFKYALSGLSCDLRSREC